MQVMNEKAQEATATSIVGAIIGGYGNWGQREQVMKNQGQ